jgi:ribosomal protein S18 acetylase RimI-like enzyme
VPPLLRRATARVAPGAAPLLLEAVPSLEIVVGDRPTALRALEACYRSERTEFAHRFGLLAEADGEVAGVVIAFPGRLYQSLKLGTGVTLARAAGARHAAGVVQRERVLSRLLPGVDHRFLYVSTLAVAPKHRRQGIATALTERVLAGAERLGLGVSLDTAIGEAPQQLYEKLGFKVVSTRQTRPSERNLIPVEGMLRMERR